MTPLVKWLTLIIVIIILAVIAVLVFDIGRPSVSGATSFSDCAKQGNPIIELYPRRCTDSRGETFTENIGNELEKDNLIRISLPRPNQVIKSPLKITGFARGQWFFEGSFPVVLLNQAGHQVTTGIAQTANGADWMTTDFVPFEATLNFSNDKFSGTGELVLKKDNPSGDPAHDDSLIVPVTFSATSPILETNLATSS